MNKPKRKQSSFFTEEQESCLIKYFKKYAYTFFGINVQEVRKLSYDFCVFKGIKTLVQWREKQCTGLEWHKNSFTKFPRYKNVSVKTTMSQGNVSMFMSRFEEVKRNHGIDHNRIWNVDESAVDFSSAGWINDCEISVINCICADGGSMQPMFVIPKVAGVERVDEVIRDAENTCIYNSTGEMTNDTFLRFFERFVAHVEPSKDKPVMLLLDHNKTHFDFRLMDLAEESGVVLLSFPRYCSDWMQPLTVSRCGKLVKKLKHKAKEESESIKKILSVHEFLGVIKRINELVMSRENILEGFATSGIHPFDPKVMMGIAATKHKNRPVINRTNKDTISAHIRQLDMIVEKEEPETPKPIKRRRRKCEFLWFLYDKPVVNAPERETEEVSNDESPELSPIHSQESQSTSVLTIPDTDLEDIDIEEERFIGEVSAIKMELSEMAEITPIGAKKRKLNDDISSLEDVDWNPTSQPNDLETNEDCSAYGEQVAKKMMKLDVASRKLLRERIDAIVAEVELNDYAQIERGFVEVIEESDSD